MMYAEKPWVKWTWILGFLLTGPPWTSLPAAEPVLSPVVMREQTLVIPTYQVGPAEPNPIFYAGRSYQGAKGPVYPYPLFDRLTDVRQDKSYRAVLLENQYVQFSVLPELGGRIFTGLDKTNQYDFFYRQHVIKPALIGMIGAWISGGVEWNIPHHHRASTFIAVDHKLVENPDGSKTVWVGEIELRHRMKWLVGLTVYPGKSYIEATVKLFNRTPLPHSLLYFANVAVHANPEYQVLFPPGTEYGTQHAKREFVDWPIGRGRYGGLDRTGIDVSWWKNNPTPVSIFAWNYEDDFLGGYDHGRKAGVVMVADHHAAPGKKFFEFGNGPEGQMWDKVLTDSDGPYLELMAGAYSDNQPDYSWCQPYEVKTVKQYWYPVRELGGLKNANLDAAVNLDIDASGMARFAFNATSQFPGARVVLAAAGKTLFEERIDIAPDKPFHKEVRLPEGTKARDVRVSLISAGGRELIAYRPIEPKGEPMPKPIEPPPAPEKIATNEELYLAGLRLEQFHSPAREPYPYYEEALRRDPGDYRVNTALGILYCKRGMYAQAEARLNAAVQRATKNYTSPKDGEALYYLGVALKAQGKLDAAAVAFHKAAWSQAFSGAANLALAEIACQKPDLAAALEFASRAIAGNAANTKALCLEAAVLRRLGRYREAESATARALSFDPLDFWAANERALAKAATGGPEAARKDLDELKALMRGQPPSHLELAADYARCGLWDEAIEVLGRLVAGTADKSRVHPMAYYHLGYYWERKGDSARALEDYRLAAQMPPDYCFPFQLESANALRSAARLNPADARAWYYLGNLLYDLQPENAVAAWEQSRKLDGNLPVVHRNLGLAYARVEKNTSKAVVGLEKAVALNPADPKLFAELDTLYEAAGVDPRKRLAILTKNHETVARRDEALVREIALEILVGRVDRAIALLEDHHFHLWEGESGVHELYVDAHLLRGRRNYEAKDYAAALRDYSAAQEYPDRFETGKPYRGDAKAAEIEYLLGLTCEAMGQPDQARAHYEAALKPRHDWSEPRYYQGLAYRKLGQESKAAEIFEGLVQFGQRALESASGEDFFAKFGTKESENVRKARAHYLVGLGYLGQGKKAEAKRQFEAALAKDASHLGARTMAAALGAP
ncbi:MAG: DUF5107 domain-containing protein [Pirellulales bacterium]